jgi:DNA-binding MarR family transcriptional regulator
MAPSDTRTATSCDSTSDAAAQGCGHVSSNPVSAEGRNDVSSNPVSAEEPTCTSSDIAAAGSDDTLSKMATAVSLMEGFLMQRLREEGVTGIVPSHGSILFALYTLGPTTKGNLARIISRCPSTVTTLVHKLEDLGFVKVENSPDDVRVSVVSLTDRGKAFEPRFMKASLAWRSAFEDALDENERRQLRQTLDKLCKAFGKDS